MKKSILYIAFAGVLGMTSCADDLNIEKLGNAGSEADFYKTDADADAAITACYLDLRDYFDLVKDVDDLMSDDYWCGGSKRMDDVSRETIGSFTVGSTDSKIVQSLFETSYKLIYHANLVIEKFENFDTPVKKQALADAYFFRGMAHFYLGAFFGTAPIVDHLLKSDEYAQSNSTREGLYNQAVSDFLKSIETGNHAKKPNKETNVARITEGAVKSYLGKTYVFLGEWSKAAKVLDEVIESDQYALYQGDYSSIHHSMTDYSCENILELNNVADFANALFSWYPCYRGYRGEFFEYTTCLDKDLYTGWGFCNPTKDLYDAFVAEEGVDGYRLNNVIKTQQQMTDMNFFLLEGKVLHGHEGYYDWKHRLLQSDFIMAFPFGINNLLFMRYAEVLLLAAEAHVMNNSAAKATNYVNMIRERAKLPKKDAVTMEDVKLEKRLECYGEGCRWMDLVRWGEAAAKLANKGKSMPCWDGKVVKEEYTDASAGFKAGKNEVLPIPEQELVLNTNIKQNPNW